MAIPPEQNSGPLILKLKRQVRMDWWKEDEAALQADRPEPAPGDPLTPQEAAFLQARMAEIEPLLLGIRRLADRPRGCFPIAWTPDVIGSLIPHVQEGRAMTALLARDTRWQAYQGDYATALVSCRAMVSVAGSLDDEPTLISQLVRTACLSIALWETKHTLACGEPTAPSLVPLQQALEVADNYDATAVGLRGERAGMHQLFSNLEDGTVPAALIVAVGRAPRGAGSTIADKAEELYLMASVQSSHVWLLRHFNAALEACRLPAAEQTARMKALSAEPAKAPALAKLLTPAWIKCHEAFRREHAGTRCAIAALAAERYRLKHGQWPADLAALTLEFLAAVPADPYTDAPLKYCKTTNGVVVFSVGPDGTHKGDYYDQVEPPAPTPSGSPGSVYEFRLWDPALRGRPLAERLAQRD
jgi:hypothetical protein